MQAMAEAYDMMKRMTALDTDEMAAMFGKWNDGCLGGYLMGIAPPILRYREKSAPLLDAVLDRANQKGTGREASMAGLDLGVPAPAIDEAVSARFISSLLDERRRASELYQAGAGFSGNREAFLGDLEEALYCAIVISHGQGFDLMEKASAHYGWHLDRAAIARLWRGGCIIQSKMMSDIEEIFNNKPEAGNILLEEPIRVAMGGKQAGRGRSVSAAALHGIPAPVLSSALAYFDSYRSKRLPANLVQALRDCFGAHGYERIDAPEGKIFHTDWGE
jgi:6-phosphogluconate dehydrogenase